MTNPKAHCTPWMNCPQIKKALADLCGTSPTNPYQKALNPSFKSPLYPKKDQKLHQTENENHNLNVFIVRLSVAIVTFNANTRFFVNPI